MLGPPVSMTPSTLTSAQGGSSDSVDISMADGQDTDMDFGSTSSRQPDTSFAAGDPFYMQHSLTYNDGDFFGGSSSVDPDLMRNPQVRDEALFDLRSTTSSSAPRFPSMDDFLANLFPVDPQFPDFEDFGPLL